MPWITTSDTWEAQYVRVNERRPRHQHSLDSSEMKKWRIKEGGRWLLGLVEIRTPTKFQGLYLMFFAEFPE